MHELDFAAHLLLHKVLALCLVPQSCPLGDLAQGLQGSWWQGLGVEPRSPGSWPGTLAARPHCLSLSSLALCALSTPSGGMCPDPTSFHWARCPTPVSGSAIWGIGSLAVCCPWGQAQVGEGEGRPFCWSGICKAGSLMQSFFFTRRCTCGP